MNNKFMTRSLYPLFSRLHYSLHDCVKSNKFARENSSPGRLHVPPPYHSAETPTFHHLPSSRTADNVTRSDGSPSQLSSTPCNYPAAFSLRFSPSFRLLRRRLVEANSIPIGSRVEEAQVHRDVGVFFVSCWIQVFTEIKRMCRYLKERRFGAATAYMQLYCMHRSYIRRRSVFPTKISTTEKTNFNAGTISCQDEQILDIKLSPNRSFFHLIDRTSVAHVWLILKQNYMFCM